MAQTRTTDAVTILHRRYGGDDPERMAALARARACVDAASKACSLRAEARLTQRQLADLVGVSRASISRLENEAYGGRAPAMLARIRSALSHRAR